MTRNIATSLCSSTPTESPIQFPGKINIPWPEELHFRRGSPELLCEIEVYYDFDWFSQFRHNRSQFRHGKSLAQLARGSCPQGKTPALLLTRCDDAKEGAMQSGHYYILVVNIARYLDESEGDAATEYFSGKLQGNITSGRYVSDFPEPLDRAVIQTIIDNHLDLPAVARWVHGKSDRLEQLKNLLATTNARAEQPASIREVIKALESLDQIPEEHVNAILIALQELGANGFSSILEWVLESQDVVKHLARLNVHSLERLNSVIGMARLKEVLTFWQENKNSPEEEFWQRTFDSNVFVLSQVFPFAVVILEQKAYVGGTRVDRSGGNFIDFLCAKSLTRNAVLIEIKTPETPLLKAKPYRADVYNVHGELSGALIQVLNYRDSLTKEYYQSRGKSGLDYEAFNPQCLVIAGNTEQLNEEAQRRSFELFRNGLKDVQVVTYDELFDKIEVLVDLLEGRGDPDGEHGSHSESLAIEVPRV